MFASTEVTGQRPVVQVYVARFAEPGSLVSFKNRLNKDSVEHAGNYRSNGYLQGSEVSGQRPDVLGGVKLKWNELIELKT